MPVSCDEFFGHSLLAIESTLLFAHETSDEDFPTMRITDLAHSRYMRRPWNKFSIYFDALITTIRL
jgi:hypothetical protein